MCGNEGPDARGLAHEISTVCLGRASAREHLQSQSERFVVMRLQVGAVLMQSPAQAILIAGQMVASTQIDAQIGIILTIGTSIGGSSMTDPKMSYTCSADFEALHRTKRPCTSLPGAAEFSALRAARELSTGGHKF